MVAQSPSALRSMPSPTPTLSLPLLRMLTPPQAHPHAHLYAQVDAVRDAILRAEPKPSFESEWLASTTVERARARIVASSDGAALREMAVDEAPLEAVVEALRSSLVQRTSSRV